MTPARRGRGEGGVSQRPDGTWYAMIDAGYTPEGKRRRRSVSARTKKECLEKLRRLQREIDQGVTGEGSTVAEWVTYWLEEIAPRKVRPSTLRTYEGYARTWIVPELGKRRLRDLTPEDVRRLHAAMEAAGRSDATRRQVHAILSRALRVAEQEGRVGRNVAALVDRPPVGKGSHGFLTEDEFRAVARVLVAWSEAGRHEDTARYVVALYCGLRQGEALGLTWDDIHLDDARPFLRVWRSVRREKGGGMVYQEPKSKASVRTVPLHHAPATALRAWREHAPDGRVWDRRPEVDNRTWHALLAEAGVPARPLHAARATTASLLDAGGATLKEIAEVLGQSTIQTTWRAYLHSDDERAARAVASLPGLPELES